MSAVIRSNFLSNAVLTASLSSFKKSLAARRTRLLLSAIALLFLFQYVAATCYAAEFTANVNRYTIEEGESLELNLKVDESSILSKPDFSPLEQDFEVINISRSSQVQIINGNSQSSTNWKVTLFPKSTGELTIPSIRLRKLRTEPIIINVNKASRSTNNLLQTRPQIMVEAAVDKTTVYVQEQIVYTIRLLFQGVQIRQWNLSEPKADNAIVHTLGEPVQYEKNINGINYGVLEKRYAIFPQASGALQIPPITFAGVINDASSRRYLGQGQQIIKRSQEINLTVSPANSDFKASNWLPAKALRLEEQWSPELSNIKVGESLTWSLILKALGQNSATLPPIALQFPEEFKVYPDQAKLEEGQNADGLIGQRSESIAIIATKPGTYLLPSVEVIWWDTENDQQQIVRIPARTITVAPATQTAQLPTAVEQSIEPEAPALVSPSKVPEVNPANERELKQWKLATLILSAALATLIVINIMVLLRKNKGDSRQPKPDNLSKKELQQQEQERLNSLLNVLKNNSPREVPIPLLHWAESFLGHKVHSVGQLKSEVDNTRLADELNKLEAVLYSGHDSQSNWTSENLTDILRTISKENHSLVKEKKTPLVPIYPTN